MGRCAVGPIPQVELNDYYLPQLHAIPPPSNPGSYEIPFAAMANHVGFYALHRITTTVTTDGLDEAVAEADTRFRRVAVALAFTGSPIKAPSCSVRLVRWQRLDELTRAAVETGVPKSLVVEGQRPVEVVSFDKMTGATDLALMADSDAALGRLFDTWYRAEQVYLTASREDDRRWAVIEYARLLEDIAQLLVPLQKVEEAKLLALRSRLLTDLEAALSQDAVFAAVKWGTDELSTLRGDATKVRIERAGEVLDVGVQVVDNAKKTWAARSQGAAHARPKVLSEDQVYWARASAAVYLVGYIQLRTKAQS